MCNRYWCEPGQDWKIAALTFNIYVHFFHGDFMNNDEKFMKIALLEAKKAYLKDEIPVGAVIVKNGKIISKGFNLRESKKNTIKHAEIVAIEKACSKVNNWRLIDCTMYVTMYPCPMCASAINQARIFKVVCGAIPQYVDKGLINKIVNDKSYGLPVEIVENVLEDECTALLKKFFNEKRQ